MGIFSRHCVKVCDQNLEKLLTKWVGKDPRPIDLFGHLLESIGVVMPVTLRNFDEGKNSFECATYDGKVLSLAILFGDLLDAPPLLYVKEGEVCLHYSYLGFGEKPWSLELESSTIKKNNQVLNNCYCDHFCNRSLYLHGDYYLKINVYEPEPQDEDNVRVLKYRQDIENYLLGLRFPCTAQQIYKEVMQLYRFGDEVISMIDSIEISVEKILSKDERGNMKKVRMMSAILTQDSKVFLQNRDSCNVNIPHLL